ncbi:hypothetical protein RR42_m0859 [Cupriavidus basilensis]|uniref:Uncharacterized protein n=1 Tax=Cupriavidus basilensis TaxID=68895 RepID=A0A0C4YCA6_9BURK|nr:hypothetical protein RR42_m0859 [Cupriavidus basilensis]
MGWPSFCLWFGMRRQDSSKLDAEEAEAHSKSAEARQRIS